MSRAAPFDVDPAVVDRFHEDGAVLVRGVLDDDWLRVLGEPSR